MSAAIKVRKLPNGQIQARRLDGEPMTEADRQEARRLIAAQGFEAEPAPRAWEIERVTDWSTGEIRALHLCSAPLETHLWVLHDRDFEPPDDDPIFYVDEFDSLQNKSVEELRGIVKAKLAFPRCRVVQ